MNDIQSVEEEKLQKGQNSGTSNVKRNDLNDVEISYDENYTPKKKSRWKFANIWTTRLIAREQGKEAEIKATIREFLIYVIFLITLSFVTFGPRSSSIFYYTDSMAHLFLQTPFTINNSSRVVKFGSVCTIPQFWGYLETVMVESIYQSSTVPDSEPEILGKDKKVLNENKILGVPRLRQLRVKNDSCEIPEVFRRTFSTCYDEYSRENEDTQPFGPRNGTAMFISGAMMVGAFGAGRSPSGEVDLPPPALAASYDSGDTTLRSPRRSSDSPPMISGWLPFINIL